MPGLALVVFTGSLGALLGLAVTTANANADAAAPHDRPLVIGHRGAPAYVPEHTLESYQLAIEQGADFIEPDLVATKDGELIARHEPYLGGDNADVAGADSTDVASRPEFRARRKTVVLDGVRLTGWFAEDFTLAEIRTLRARERMPAVRPASAGQNGRYRVPTFGEIIDLIQGMERRTGRRIGVYPETKHPSYHRSIGLPLEERLLAVLRERGFTDPARVYIQSFEVSNLQRLNALTDLPLVQLLGGRERPYDLERAGDPRSYDDLATACGLAFIASYADGVGPAKSRVVPVVDGSLGEPTTFVADAHAAGLVVHPYTFRRENSFLPAQLRNGDDPAAAGNDAAEYDAFRRAGVDGVFSDNADRALAAFAAPGRGDTTAPRRSQTARASASPAPPPPPACRPRDPDPPSTP
jgi:glycerophosphoryl diester phosphodiesterase